jgi:hypothetical protein
VNPTVRPTARRLLAVALFTAAGAAVFAACTLGLALHALARGWERLCGTAGGDLAGDEHEQGGAW